MITDTTKTARMELEREIMRLTDEWGKARRLHADRRLSLEDKYRRKLDAIESELAQERQTYEKERREWLVAQDNYQFHKTLINQRREELMLKKNQEIATMKSDNHHRYMEITVAIARAFAEYKERYGIGMEDIKAEEDSEGKEVSHE